MEQNNYKAFAKLNLFLSIKGKRKDGYHDLDMIMQSVELHDDLFIKTNESKDVSISVVDEIGLNDIQMKGLIGSNLISKVAKYMFDKYSINNGLDINLVKRIPLGGGLAGGSSDAAAVIQGINDIFKLSLTKEDMIGIGALFGADIPFAINRNLARVFGIGDKIIPLNTQLSYIVLLVIFSFGISTADAFNRYDELYGNYDESNGDALQIAILDNNQKCIYSSLYNSFENILEKNEKYINIAKKLIIENGGFSSLMSGSGPTVFGLYDDENLANKAKTKIEEFPFVSKVVITKMI